MEPPERQPLISGDGGLTESEIVTKSRWEKIREFLAMLFCCCTVFVRAKKKKKSPLENAAAPTDRPICCFCRILNAVGDFCMRGAKNNGSSTSSLLAKDNGNGKGIVETEDSSQIPIINEEAFDLLREVERQSNKLHNEHKTLRKEADEHIKEIAQKFGMIMSLGVTGSLGVGLVTCGIALNLSILYCALLIITITPIFFLGWIRLNGCYSMLFVKMREQGDLLVYLNALKLYYIESVEVQITVCSTSTENSSEGSVPTMSETSTVKGPPPIPQSNKSGEFHSRLDAVIGYTRADTRECICMSRLIVASANFLGYLHCAVICYILYVGVCKGDKKADSSSP